MPQVFYGVFFHWLGGLASGSFYVPYKAVKKWSWEVYWLAGGFFSWIIAPWLLAAILTCGLLPSMSDVFSGKVSEATIEKAMSEPSRVPAAIVKQAAIQEAAASPAFDAIAKTDVMIEGKKVKTITPDNAVKAWAALVNGEESDVFVSAPSAELKGELDALVRSSIETAFQGGAKAMGYAYLFGCLWGIGGLTFGLTMRYLGMSLGMAIALGYCTVLGTIMPDIVKGTFVTNLTTQPPYAVIILGLGVCLLGVILAGVAGMSKEREMPEEVKKAAIKEFNFGKGLLVATISGVFSACMAYGLQAAEPLAQISALHGTGSLWVGLPKLCIVLLGGFTSNFIWCALLLAKNKTTYQFFNKEILDPDAADKTTKVKVNMLWNYVFSAIAGTTWYFQFFFYSMGETRMGEYQFSSWTLHMASIIIFSSCWGLALREWAGSSRFTKFILGVAIFTLLYSTIVVGYGNLMKQSAEPAEQAAVVAVEGQADADAADAIEADVVAPEAAEEAAPVEAAADAAETTFVVPAASYVLAC